MGGLDRLVKALGRMRGNFFADPRNFRQFGFSLGIVRLACKKERFLCITLAVSDDGVQARLTAEIKGLFCLFTAEKIRVDSIKNTANALGKQKLVIDRHVRVLSAARRTAGLSCDGAVYLLPIGLLPIGQKVSDLSDDQLAVGDIGCQCGERRRKGIGIPFFVDGFSTFSVAEVKTVIEFIRTRFV